MRKLESGNGEQDKNDPTIDNLFFYYLSTGYPILEATLVSLVG